MIKQLALIQIILAILPIILLFSLIPSVFAETGTLTCDKKNTLLVTTKNYYNFPGDVVEIVGCVSNSAPPNDLFLEISTYEKQYVFKHIDVNDDGTFHYEFKTSDTVPIFPSVWIKMTYGHIEAKNHFIVSENAKRCSNVSSENLIQFDTNKENFEKEDTLQVFVCLAPETTFTRAVNIEVYDSEGNRVALDVTIPRADSTVESEFKIGDEFKADGNYTVKVSDASGHYATNKTIMVPEFGSNVFIVILASITGIFVMQNLGKKIL